MDLFQSINYIVCGMNYTQKETEEVFLIILLKEVGILVRITLVEHAITHLQKLSIQTGINIQRYITCVDKEQL